jgi:hypothetical protein
MFGYLILGKSQERDEDVHNHEKLIKKVCHKNHEADSQEKRACQQKLQNLVTTLVNLFSSLTL